MGISDEHKSTHRFVGDTGHVRFQAYRMSGEKGSGHDVTGVGNSSISFTSEVDAARFAMRLAASIQRDMRCEWAKP